MPRILPIAQLGHPILRERAYEIDDVTSGESQSLIDDLFFTVAEAGGMGIAAPQAHQSKRIFIMSSRPNARYPYAPEMEPTAIINPEITWRSDEIEKGWEGCLSVPGIRGLVPRSTSIKVKYLTRDNQSISAELEGFLARVFQHELDHLDGLVFLDRVETTKDIVMEQEWQRIIAADKDTGIC